MVRAIEKKFKELKEQGKKAFIPFITAGDPDIETTTRLVRALEDAGAHIVELGIPFSDPIADGPTIQRSSERALRRGYRLTDYFDVVKTIRHRTSMPLVFFSYFNPILQYGLDEFARDARAAGIDGVLATDVTPEEGQEYCACLQRHDLDPIFLVAPTSDTARINRIVACCRGFVYVVSRTGVTGAQATLSESVIPTLTRVRQCTQLPVAVGFGISQPDQVRAVWQIADGAVVGSALVAQIEKHAGAPDLVSIVSDFCRRLIPI